MAKYFAGLFVIVSQQQHNDAQAKETTYCHVLGWMLVIVIYLLVKVS